MHVSECVEMCSVRHCQAKHRMQVFSNTAAGLPAELGASGQMAVQPTVRGGWTPAKGVAAWRQRLAAQRRGRYPCKNARSEGQ